MINSHALREDFRQQFGHEEARVFRAPGRVNLIGEHTDYNDGFVLPVAIDRETVVAAAANDSRRVRVHSLNVEESAEFDLDNPGPKLRGVWLDYIEGVAQSLRSRGAHLVGVDMALSSDVPVGAGLSSSAALEISTGMAMLAISNVEIDRVELALAGQQAEHEYVGTRCGIMDQLVVACGLKGHALLIDCRSLAMRQIPLDTSETVIAICDTRVKHELSSSEYNKRREECERGVEILSRVLPDIRALRDVSLDDFEMHEELLPEPIRSRCRHVVTENARTLSAADALEAADFALMGRLMLKSHESLRDDYEVSCMELDSLVEIATSIEGVRGARMTGGGFGGCTVNLVERHALEKFQEKVTGEYNKVTGKIPTIYVSEPADGAREITGSPGSDSGE
ncbi:MAG TPA: galactokinase [Pyrinomonadaceae bacterium]|nr:galactokinase [Pyrinomonadaceae bacterium]